MQLLLLQKPVADVLFGVFRLGLAYAGSNREDVLSLLLPVMGDSKSSMEVRSCVGGTYLHHQRFNTHLCFCVDLTWTYIPSSRLRFAAAIVTDRDQILLLLLFWLKNAFYSVNPEVPP